MKTPRLRKGQDISGFKFGRLTAVEFIGFEPIGSGGNRRAIWACICSCGKRITASSNALKMKNTKSCGCLVLDIRTSHDLSRSLEYGVWAMMKQRCYNRKCKLYKHYGGRGINVCKRWRESFSAFIKDMGRRPKGRRISIERINNDGNYTPKNCKWATPFEQMANCSTTRNLTHNGQTHSVSEWARRLGESVNTISGRLKRGWKVGQAIGLPVMWPCNQYTSPRHST